MIKYANHQVEWNTIEGRKAYIYNNVGKLRGHSDKTGRKDKCLLFLRCTIQSNKVKHTETQNEFRKVMARGTLIGWNWKVWKKGTKFLVCGISSVVAPDQHNNRMEKKSTSEASIGYVVYSTDFCHWNLLRVQNSCQHQKQKTNNKKKTAKTHVRWQMCYLNRRIFL